jgi:hypothetical protein
LNELAIQNSPHAIVDVLKVITEESKDKGIGIFCTAGIVGFFKRHIVD